MGPVGHIPAHAVERWQRTVAQVARHCATATTRPVFACLCWTVAGPAARGCGTAAADEDAGAAVVLVGADSYRLALARLPFAQAAGLPEGGLELLTDAVRTTKLLQRLDATAEVQVAASDHVVFLDQDQTRIVLHRTSARYPNYRAVIDGFRPQAVLTFDETPLKVVLKALGRQAGAAVLTWTVPLRAVGGPTRRSDEADGDGGAQGAQGQGQGQALESAPHQAQEHAQGQAQEQRVEVTISPLNREPGYTAQHLVPATLCTCAADGVARAGARAAPPADPPDEPSEPSAVGAPPAGGERQEGPPPMAQLIVNRQFLLDALALGQVDRILHLALPAGGTRMVGMWMGSGPLARAAVQSWAMPFAAHADHA
jgi:hypothetical protein